MNKGLKMLIAPGPASQDLASKIADLTKAKIVPVTSKFFPDGESYVRFDGELEGEHVVIVQTTNPPQDTRLLQALLMVSTAKDLGAKEITLVAPYLAYSRQDKRFFKGEALSLKVIVDLFEKAGANRLITVNSHSPQALKRMSLKCEDLSAIPLLANYFKNQGLTRTLSLALGKKGMTMAMEADKILKGGYDYLKTTRNPTTGKVTVEKREYNVADRVVIIFDDIISTGGTMVEAVRIMREQGSKKIYVACVHPLLIGDAMQKILKSGADQIVGTDSVPSPVSTVSVAPLIADVLR